MFDDDDRLLAQIRVDPDDDQLRLVYADALLSRGDERGEYVALAVASHDTYAKLTVEQRVRWLALEKKRSAWAAELGCAELAVTWRRGLPYALHGSVQAFLTHPEVLRRLPIASISFTSDARELAALAALPELAFIEAITLPHDERSKMDWASGVIHDPLPRAELAALCASPHLAKLKRLSFDKQALSEATADVLGAAAVLDQLEVLSLGGIEGDSLEQVLRGKLTRLKALIVWESSLRETGGRAFARSALPALERLELRRAGLVEGARELLGSRNLAKVQKLRITSDQLVNDGAFALGKSPHTRELREVSFEQSWIGTTATNALAHGKAPFAHLVTLELSQCDIEDPGAIALARSSRFPMLAKLDLRSNKLTREGAIAFARPESIPTLTSLGISANTYPSGEYEEVTDYDQGMEMGQRTVPIPFHMDVITSWFAKRPGLNVF